MSVSFPVQVSAFPPGSPWAHLNGSRAETFTWSAVLRAAMVAGYPTLAAIPSRQFSRWRAAGLHMALRRSRGQLIQPPEWRQLDPSEKAAVSSLLGVVVTKLLVERFLNAPIFLFLDVHFYARFPVGAQRIRPDFVAMTPRREWFSVEAKGRTRFRQATLRKGKVQARALGRVNGRRVQTGIVCVTSFRRGRMEARFADPKSQETKLLAAKIEPTEALWRYYGGLLRFREFARPTNEAPLLGTDFKSRLWQSNDLDIQFGISSDLEDALERRSSRGALAVLRKIAVSSDLKRNPYLGSDGIVVIPGESWRNDPRPEE